VGHTGPVNAFTLSLPSRIVFGPGTAGQLEVPGTRPLIVTGSDPARVAHLLPGTESAVRVTGEPTLDAVRAAVVAGRERGVDCVVAIGGGSVIDLAKAVAMLLGNGGDPLDYLEVIGRGHRIAQPSLPTVALPTTAGTGAEVTANAVISSPSDGVKASLRSSSMVPHLAIVDPDLTLGCPPAVTASAGMDALTQCLEPFVSIKANPVTDGWARTGLIAAGRGLRAAHADGSDRAARSDMALCSLMGGLALANAKLGAVHGFASVLSAMAQAPHGATCAALLAPVCRANLTRASADLNARFDEVARCLTGAADARAADGLAWIETTTELLDIPGLSRFGLSLAQVDEVVAKTARASSTAGNPVELTPDELAAIYEAAL